MNIALLSNFWYLRGGLERVMLGDARGLEARGHRVGPFASAHPLNEPAPYAQYFPVSVDHGALGAGLRLRDRATVALRLFHNRAAVKGFDRFADGFRPDVIHQHGLSRQLSVSVLERAHARGLPTVLTLHDHGLRCPSGLLSREKAPMCLAVSCAGHRYDRAVRFQCVHGSRAASALAAAELLVARALRRYERAVDLFLVPSGYVWDRMAESGLPAQRMRVMPNSVARPDAEPAPPGTYVLAFGRLVSVKGFGLIVDLAHAMPDVRFVIAGDGPERAGLEKRAAGAANLKFTGQLGDVELASTLRGARAVIVPSIWPEPFGMVVLEAWREARPVIVTRRGALPEIVQDGQTGFVIDPADLETARMAITRLMADPALADSMGRAGRREVETTYAIDAHMDRLESTYLELLARAA